MSLLNIQYHQVIIRGKLLSLLKHPSSLEVPLEAFVNDEGALLIAYGGLITMEMSVPFQGSATQSPIVGIMRS